VNGSVLGLDAVLERLEGGMWLNALDGRRRKFGELSSY
jgi:hypothetical protein